MTRITRASIILVLGTTCTLLVVTGAFARFVQRHMQIPLLLAGATLIALGVVEVVMSYRHLKGEPTTWTAWAAPKVGFLLFAPILVLVAVNPRELGASAAGRVTPLTPTKPSAAFPALVPGSDGVISLRHVQFLNRAFWDYEGSLRGKQIRLVGIVVKAESVPDGFLLTRFMVSCCAADAIPLQVAVHGKDSLNGQPSTAASYPDDQWVEVIGEWLPPKTTSGTYASDGRAAVVEMDIISISKLDTPPSKPYESPY